MDLNRIIMESIQNMVDDKKETLSEGVIDKIKEESQELIKKGKGFIDKIKNEAPNYEPGIEDKDTRNYIPGVKDKELSFQVKEKAQGLIKKMKDNPEITGGVAAAIAAGLGGLVLAKKLRSTKKGKAKA